MSVLSLADAKTQCLECGVDFTAVTHGGNVKKYCSLQCGRAYRQRAKRRPVEKECPVCGVAFTAENNRRKNCSPECTREVSRRTRLATPGYHRDWYLRNTYGLDSEDYDRMVEAQQGRCAICAATPSRLFVDHDHKSGKLRELLCLHCNSALGQIFDNPDLALGLAAYLLTHGGE
jgi:hypothetical protein